MKQEKVNIQEQRVPKFISTLNGFEILSNDGSVKIILSRSRIFSGQMENEHLSVTYYVKEGEGYEKSNTQDSYPSIDDYMRRLANNEEYTEACMDYEKSDFYQNKDIL